MSNVLENSFDNDTETDENEMKEAKKHIYHNLSISVNILKEESRRN